MNYAGLLNPTVREMQPSGIRKYFDLAESMQNVISLGVGEPDFLTPWHIRQKGIETLESGKTRYTSNSGLLSLRQEISKYIQRKYDLEYDPKTQTLITIGGSEAIDAFFRTVVCQGDEVIIPQPSFVCYSPLVELCGGKAVPVQTKAEDEFRLTADALKEKITSKTKALVLPFPNNPTGAIMRRGDLEEIVAVLEGTDILVLSDEIYAELTYGEEPHVSIANIGNMKDRTVVVNGFSKSFSMTGWRLGYALGPEPIINQMTKIHQFAIMCAPTTSQTAAIEALKNGDGDIKKMLDEYDMRRKFVVNGLRKAGLDCFEPLGAFYAFPSIKKTGLSSDEFCQQLLRQKNVAVIPGTAFGVGGEGHVRISYCYSIGHLKEALLRIKDFVDQL